ncbi:MAG: putative hydro-lyase [Janthinobacterium lividum]
MPDILSIFLDTARETRRLIRNGAHAGHTSGQAPGHIQGNVAIVPGAYAADFELYCRRNAQACPVLAMSQPGDPHLPTLGADLDIRTDLPRYRIYRDGAPAGERTDITELWQDDFVTFVIGCSFTFERALIAAGIPLRHVTEGRNVAMYRTTLPTVPVGPFGGPLVVSMRPVRAEDADRAAEITGRYPDMHGRPVRIGDPAALGIADLSRPDYGDPVAVLPGETPVFWACGVTSQSALESARLPLFLAHAPGCMLITDLLHAAA